MTDLQKTLAISLGVATIGFLIGRYSNQRGTRLEKSPRGRTRTKTLAASREPSEAVRSTKKVEKESLPNVLINSNSTILRRSAKESEGQARTSRNNSKSTVPLTSVGSIKYPSSYYNLSKKAKWKFRKRQQAISLLSA